MILYNVENGWTSIDANSYMFQNDFGFADYLKNNKLFFTEEDIVRLVKSRLTDTEDGVFVDVGANVGAYTLSFAESFAHIFAFEPGLNTYNILCGNIAINNLSNKTTLINAGLLDESKDVVMHEYDTLGSLTHLSDEETDTLNEQLKIKGFYDYSKKITTKTLDSYNIQNIKLIKIDVEGNELKVLKGATNTLKQSNYPMLIIESWEINEGDTEELKQYKKELREELFDYIKNLGYNIEDTDNKEVFICEYKKQQTKSKVKTIFY